jgi:hypothetical protein
MSKYFFLHEVEVFWVKVADFFTAFSRRKNFQTHNIDPTFVFRSLAPRSRFAAATASSSRSRRSSPPNSSRRSPTRGAPSYTHSNFDESLCLEKIRILRKKCFTWVAKIGQTLDLQVKVYLHQQWYLCRSMLRDATQHTVRISSNVVARHCMTRTNTKITVGVKM